MAPNDLDGLSAILTRGGIKHDIDITSDRNATLFIAETATSPVIVVEFVDETMKEIKVQR